MLHGFVLVLSLICFSGYGQSLYPSAANAHSHNDYEQSSPFWLAWKHGFGSVEADIFLDNDELIVTHDKKQILRRWTLDSFYLQPLQQCITANKEYVYTDTSRHLQLMIDMKSDAISTLNKLVEKLKSYPSLINCSSLRIVISGNRPAASSFSDWPEWIRFDGVLQQEYSEKELEKIDMLSDNFAHYSSWKGEGELPEKEKQVLQDMINKTHRLNKKIRFWNAPDNPYSWKVFIELGIDYINTDHIETLSSFLKTYKKKIF